jgi:DNA transformation protein and related proteins
MAISKDFADYCCELLSGVGTPTPKRMFGGWGISVDGVTIAVIADLGKLGGSNQMLYLKVDEMTKARFEAVGGRRFEMASKDGKPMGMNYFTTPDETMESPNAMLPWARLALNAALDAKARAKPGLKAKPSAKARPMSKTMSKPISKPKAKPKAKPAKS